MSIAVGISFVVVGAIFKFALTSGKIAGFNLQIVGVILIIAGIVGMLPQPRRLLPPVSA